MKKGGCLCGDVRYEFSGVPLVTHACHCIECQKISSSAYGVNLWIEAKDLKLTQGSLAKFSTIGGSGKPHDSYFCGQCGSAIYSVYHAAPPYFRFLRSGSLDDTSWVKPDVHIFLKDRQQGVSIESQVPQYDGYYNFKDVWSEASQKRFKSIINKD